MLKTLWRVFVDGLENDKKVASSPEWNIHTLFMSKMAKINSTLIMTKEAEKPYPLEPHIPV